VFTLPTGELGLVIGDVAGSGLAAAVIMGRMRSSLRAYALQSRDPAEVLALLDRKMQHFEPGAIATVQYAVMVPALDEVRVSSAGHLPPVIAVPGHAAQLADLPGDLMIGVAADSPRRAATMPVPAGALLCLYTDGLVERRGELLDDSLGRLCRVVAAGPPDACCVSVMGAMVGNEPARDDIALLTVQRQVPATRAR
jgi:serine phosphatase RsbU (regulator of sigma subunit)